VIYGYFSKASTLPQGSIQPEIQWVWGGSFIGCTAAGARSSLLISI